MVALAKGAFTGICFDYLQDVLLSIMNDCDHLPGISTASWKAWDLRGIWSRPVPDPGLSVVTKHPSGSAKSAQGVSISTQQQMVLLSVESSLRRRNWH